MQATDGSSDMSERKSTATSGWVFVDGLVAITILLPGAFVVVWLSAGVSHPFLTTALSYLGSCLVAFLLITGVYVAVVFAKGLDEDPDLSPLVMKIVYPAVAILGAGVYYMIHNIVGVPFVESLSELLGGFVVFGGGWLALVTRMERQREREKKDAASRWP